MFGFRRMWCSLTGNERNVTIPFWLLIDLVTESVNTLPVLISVGCVSGLIWKKKTNQSWLYLLWNKTNNMTNKLAGNSHGKPWGLNITPWRPRVKFIIFFIKSHSLVFAGLYEFSVYQPPQTSLIQLELKWVPVLKLTLQAL